MAVPSTSPLSTSNPIALDAMGGDRAPGVVVAGAVEAARAYGVPILLVGPPPAVAAELARHNTAGLRLDIVATDETIDMHEHPARALRQKPRASLKLAVDLVAEGRAAAAYSAGNSGAVMAAALFALRRLPGIERPAFGSPIPTSKGVSFLIDMGANVECKPSYLVQFAAMGVAYMRLARGLAHPTVGLLSNGEEEGKGPPLIQEAYRLLAASGLNFKGNVEGKDVFAGLVDVVAADGFAGNVLLKTAEGTGTLIFDLLRAELGKSLRTKLGAALARPAVRALRRRLDYEEYGGAPVLGVNGVVLTGHGRSGPRAIRNGIRVASDMARNDLAGAIARELAQLHTTVGG
jgi:glycerol-3-phosphate acyltransferase PlsX